MVINSERQHWLSTFYVSVLMSSLSQRMNAKHREVMHLDQNHAANLQWSQDLASSDVAPEWNSLN